MDTRRCVVRGRVQGVGFRWFVTRSAEELGVRGTVRNRADGAVEGVASGAEATLAQFHEWLRRGPPAARVQEVEWQAGEAVIPAKAGIQF